MRTKAIWQTPGDDRNDKKAGNMIIESFMGGYNPKIFNNDSFLDANNYHECWNSLMSVINKIKQRVYDEGYDMFTIKHASYSSIGNACYDADIEEVWKNVVRWIYVNFEIKGIELNKHDGAPKDIRYSYKTSNPEYGLKVSAHSILRYKQRFNYDVPESIICQRLASKDLYQSYIENGDGYYYLGDLVMVIIDNNIVKTVIKLLPESCNRYKRNQKVLRNAKPKGHVLS